MKISNAGYNYLCFKVLFKWQTMKKRLEKFVLYPFESCTHHDYVIFDLQESMLDNLTYLFLFES